MWIGIGILYLFIGLAIGSAMCIHAGDDPYEPSSVGVIMAIGVVWPVILIFVAVRFFVTFTTVFVATLSERFTNDEQETEEPHGKL